jgi:hypothetical protein
MWLQLANTLSGMSAVVSSTMTSEMPSMPSR